MIMTRRSFTAFAIITAVMLALTAQSLLLIPNRQAILSQNLPPVFFFILAGIFYLVSLQDRASIILIYSQIRRVIVYIVVAICISILAAIYFLAQLYIEAFLCGSLAFSQFIAIWLITRKEEPARDYSAGYLSVINFVIGIILIAFPKILFSPLYEPAISLRFVIGIPALFSVLASGYVFFRPTQPTSKFLFNLSSVPWIIWSLVFAVNLRLPILIPGIALAVGILAANQMPWSQIILPKQDLLGRRMYHGVSIFEIIILFTLALVFYVAGSAKSVFSESALETTRDFAFLFFLAISIFLNYGSATFNMIINGLMQQLGLAANPELNQAEHRLKRNSTIAKLIAPFSRSQSDLQLQLQLQEEQVNHLNDQIQVFKRRTSQLTLLTELSQQLEAHLDHPVAAQLAVNTLQRAFECSFVSVLTYEQDHDEFFILAGAGTLMNSIPPGYRQDIEEGVVGRAARLRKTQIVNDTRLDPDYIAIDKQELVLSEVCVPLIYHGELKGILLLDDNRDNAFNNSDVTLIEAVATELLHAWDRTNYNQRLTELIQAGVSLSTLLEPQVAIREIAVITKQTLEARFTFATLLDHDGNFTRYTHSGYAPNLLKMLSKDPTGNTLMRAALNANRPFRVRDIRKFSGMANVEIDHKSMRSVLAIPIRLHRLSVGAILAFGKQGELFFTEYDEPLANLLSTQAGAAIESAYLYQELRTTLNTTTLLYQLSFQVIQSETIYEAAAAIVETTHKIANATTAGIVLQTAEGEIEAKVEFNKDGFHFGGDHPMDLIDRTIQTGQNIFISNDEKTARICYPLQTPLRKYGALWLEIPEGRWFNSRHAANLQTLTNQAAIGLERAILLVEWQRQAKEIRAAYLELETTYDHTLAALMSALDARDRETEGHSSRVGQVACWLGEELGLTPSQLKALERGALLHDIGKIGISDTILHKPGALTPEEWKLMREHPKIGSKIVEDIPFLQDTLPIIRYHQERWDGSGYPIGLKSTEIPLLARIFAVADAFDALTSIRPYREQISTEEAMKYLREQAGILFDPTVVEAFERFLSERKINDIPDPS
jgi:HD-GYP domain-containing protein (c-di-GMP phosphodiesterase class II)/putative methionine-R-sulfoxide reductase with GAF domain